MTIIKKSKAQLLKDAKRKYLKAKIVFHYHYPDGKLPKRLEGIRCIVKSNTVAIFFETHNGLSSLNLPPAALIDYTDQDLKIYGPGYRKMTEDEHAVMTEWETISNTKEFKEKETVDVLTDGSSTYWQKKNFFSQRKMEYLLGYSEQKGLLLDMNRYKNKEENCIRDKQIRGALQIHYQFIN